MPNRRNKPRLYVIAGPNGAGKTTFAREFLPHFAECTEFVNADLIAQGLSPFSPESAAFRAGRIMLEQIQDLGRQRRDFGFETTLSGKTYLPLLRKLKTDGFAVHLFFLWIPSVEMALARVADRVKRGGHDVPESVVRRRFDKGIANFFCYYRPLVDSWVVFDNSSATPQVIAQEEEGQLKVADSELFAKLSGSRIR